MGTGNPYSFATASPDFSSSASSSQTVVAGGTASYKVATTTLNGFSGAVTFSVSGLPNGASASFTPTAVTGSGSTTMNVSTGSSTPAGTYALTITASSGSLSHTAPTSLTVQALPASIGISPSSASLAPGQTLQFTATVTGMSNTAVSWSISAPIGSISTAGLYTAPSSSASQQTVTVTAVSQSNTSLSASATVTLLVGLPSALHLTNINITSGATTYQATTSITADTNFTVSGAASISFVSGNYITLGPGFQATAGTAGTTFTASIKSGN